MDKLITYTLIASFMFSIGFLKAHAEDGQSSTSPFQHHINRPMSVPPLPSSHDGHNNDISSTSPFIRTDEKTMHEIHASTTSDEIGTSTRSGMEEQMMLSHSNSNQNHSNDFHLNSMIVRVKATIDREEKIKALVNSRIQKMKSMGTDTSAAEKLALHAEMDFEQARTSLNLFSQTIASSSAILSLHSGTTTPDQATLKELKKISDTIQKYIKDGHTSLQKAIASLMKQHVFIKTQASSTNETHN